MIGPPTPVAAPANVEPRTGLIARAVPHADQGERDQAWVNGFGFLPETCDDGLLYSTACVLETDKDPADNPDLVTYTPVLLIGSDRCSTLDQSIDHAGRARRHLLSVQSFQLERAFWTGEATDDTNPNGEDRPHLADSTATVLAGGASVDMRAGIALLDQALTECLHGQQGMLHVTPLLLTYMYSATLVEWRDNRWVTPNGHVIVAGSGYPGTGPRPAPDPDPQPLPAEPNLLAHPPVAQWAYATSMVHTLLGDIDTLDDVDRPTNDRTVRAERPAAAFHGCCKFAVQITPPAIEII